MYVEPVEWISPTGEELIDNEVINGKNFIGTNWGKLLQRNQLKFKDPLRFSKTFLIKTTYFEDDLVNYFFENPGEQTCQTIKHFDKDSNTLKKFFVTTRPSLSAKKFQTKTKVKISH